jgi:hypothetical protein
MQFPRHSLFPQVFQVQFNDNLFINTNNIWNLNSLPSYVVMNANIMGFIPFDVHP